MNKLYDIVGYTYRADIFCTDHIVQQIDGEASVDDVSGAVEEKLDYIATMFGIDRENERSFDSEDFPKVVFRDQVDPGIDRCSSCGEEL
jgi:hypothetical protein